MTIEEIEAWLESKHTTLWQDFNLHDPVQRRQAAEWFAREVNACWATSPLAAEMNGINGIVWGNNA